MQWDKEKRGGKATDHAHSAHLRVHHGLAHRGRRTHAHRRRASHGHHRGSSESSLGAEAAAAALAHLGGTHGFHRVHWCSLARGARAGFGLLRAEQVVHIDEAGNFLVHHWLGRF